MYSLIAYSGASEDLNRANEDRFALTYNANRFMNGSAYLTNVILYVIRRAQISCLIYCGLQL